MNSLTIRNILDQITTGRIRVPEFQRGFVWDPERVAYLMDSIYKGYPFGSILLWRTKEKLLHERKLGPFTLPENDPDLPIDYILDGQQRLTSIFGVFQTDLAPDGDDSWTHVYFDLMSTQDAQDSQVVCLGSNEYDRSRYFPLKVLFDTVQYRLSTQNLDDTMAEKIDKIQETFKEANIPVQMMNTDNKTSVAIVFERVNQRGVELDTLQLLSAWTWSEDFDLQRKFDEISTNLEEDGFGVVPSDILLKCASGVIENDPSPSSLIKLNGSVVRDNFDIIISGIKGAIDFLRKNLHVETLDNIPYPAIIIPLTVFFSSLPTVKFKLRADDAEKIRRWFWKTCFSRRYNSQSVRSVREDIVEINKIKNGINSELAEFNVEIKSSFFTESLFRINSVSSKTFVLLLSQLRPRSFISGQHVDIGRVMREYNRAEFHHMFPQAVMRKPDIKSNYDVNCLANICILSSSDNSQIRAKTPSVYRGLMPLDVSDILKSSATTETLFSDDFNTFVEERAQLLTSIARRLLEGKEILSS